MKFRAFRTATTFLRVKYEGSLTSLACSNNRERLITRAFRSSCEWIGLHNLLDLASIFINSNLPLYDISSGSLVNPIDLRFMDTLLNVSIEYNIGSTVLDTLFKNWVELLAIIASNGLTFV